EDSSVGRCQDLAAEMALGSRASSRSRQRPRGGFDIGCDSDLYPKTHKGDPERSAETGSQTSEEEMNLAVNCLRHFSTTGFQALSTHDFQHPSLFKRSTPETLQALNS